MKDEGLPSVHDILQGNSISLSIIFQMGMFYFQSNLKYLHVMIIVSVVAYSLKCIQKMQKQNMAWSLCDCEFLKYHS